MTGKEASDIAKEATLRANLAQERAKRIRAIGIELDDLLMLYEGAEKLSAEIRNIIDVWESWAEGRARRLDEIVQQERERAAKAVNFLNEQNS